VVVDTDEDPDKFKDRDRAVRVMTWGFQPHWAKRSCIDARAETVFQNRAFARDARSHRCLDRQRGEIEAAEDHDGFVAQVDAVIAAGKGRSSTIEIFAPAASRRRHPIPIHDQRRGPLRFLCVAGCATMVVVPTEPTSRSHRGEWTMSQNRIIGIALLVLGLVLLVFGFNATQSVGEEISEAFTGRFSDETMWYLIGGAVAAVLGLVMLLKK
jgi:hypothetical protein